ncbi:retrovirus-related Pol polyprotein from transposon opus [Trichonephila clavipes]|nr:retrovirus-related Pol polyprotein from transposon opus [Trichonephila clavipes]
MARKRAENREGSLGFPGFVKPVFTIDSKPLGRRKRSAEEYRKEYIRDAFIRGLKCPSIRLRLLENTSMTLDQAFEQARTLESAEVHAASYMGSSFPVQSAAMKTEDFSEETVATSAASSSSSRSQKCFICGNDLHSRTLCPARDVTCRNSGKKGHYQRVCKSRPGRNSSNVVASSNTLVAISGSTHCLQKSIIKALVNNIQLSALIDTGSSLSFLNEKYAAKCKLKVEPYLGKISMANSSMVTETEGVYCRPLVTKSRGQAVEDNIFMAFEVQKLLQEGVIEPYNSPWRAQAFVIRGENLFSKIDLQSAYHQIPIQDSERYYTAFKACGKLYQFLRVPFGVTNGVACFQRVIDKIIEDEGLTLIYPFIDDVTVCGKDQKEHDENLEKFMTDGIIKPDPERLKPLRDMPVPKDSSALQRALGMFAHYCRWIPGFSKKIRPLLGKKQFPLSRDAVLTFSSLNDDVANL